MKIEYIKQGDYLIPNFELPKQEKVNIGRYGGLRLEYLKNHKKALYTTLKMQNKLTSHLVDIQDTATCHINRIITDLVKEEGVTEELKDNHQMEWVGKMNNIIKRAEEITVAEIIFDGGAA